MATKGNDKDRRGVLKYIGMTFLGFASWPFIRRATGNAEAGVFAGLFLKDTPTVQIPAGYYDSESQLFIDSETKKPVFVAQAETEGRRLSEKELSELLEGDGFISLKEFKKQQEEMIKVRGKSTRSTYTSLKTTFCCPIITDERSDNIPDD
ncbi:MAG: hypothetical protein HXY46_12345 [Syntrophaceae bacterium]|nr:hypothetical protein [Syntrophaceae bacterium]